MSRFLAPLCLAAFLVLAAGCHNVAPYKVTFIADDTIKKNNASFAVHVVGIDPNSYPKWESYSMSAYWNPSDDLRHSMPVYEKIYFGPNSNTVQSLEIDDPIWKKWIDSGATKLFIMGNLPGMIEDKRGAEDKRRQIVDIDNMVYVDNLSSHEVKIRVSTSGFTVETPRKPK